MVKRAEAVEETPGTNGHQVVSEQEVLQLVGVNGKPLKSDALPSTSSAQLINSESVYPGQSVLEIEERKQRVRTARRARVTRTSVGASEARSATPHARLVRAQASELRQLREQVAQAAEQPQQAEQPHEKSQSAGVQERLLGLVGAVMQNVPTMQAIAEHGTHIATEYFFNGGDLNAALRAPGLKHAADLEEKTRAEKAEQDRVKLMTHPAVSDALNIARLSLLEQNAEEAKRVVDKARAALQISKPSRAPRRFSLNILKRAA